MSIDNKKILIVRPFASKAVLYTLSLLPLRLYTLVRLAQCDEQFSCDSPPT